MQALLSLIYVYFRPRPNGDQPITLSAAGVVGALTVPTDANRAVISNSVACYVRFGATAANGTGTYYAANQGILLDSPEKLSSVSIYATGACTLFTQYYK